MTESIEQRLTEAALEAKTPEGARELAAAEAMVRASTLMWKAFEQSGLTQRELADALGVSEGRVSQILHGDGNVRLSTLARYLRATGYLTRIEALPADESVPVLRSRGTRRVGRQGLADPHDIHVTQVAHGGRSELKFTFVPSGVPIEAAEVSTTNHVGTTRARFESWTSLGAPQIGTI